MCSGLLTGRLPCTTTIWARTSLRRWTRPVNAIRPCAAGGTGLQGHTSRADGGAGVIPEVSQYRLRVPSVRRLGCFRAPFFPFPPSPYFRRNPERASQAVSPEWLPRHNTLVATVSIPNGLPRPFRLTLSDIVPYFRKSFNPKRASQAVSPAVFVV